MALFSEREIRGVAVFLPLAGLLMLAIALVRPKADPGVARSVERQWSARTDSVVMAPFDPNTATRDDLLRLGLTNYEAVSLLKFRAAGKVFRIREDVSLCYGIADSTYRRLEPYIVIGAEYAITPRDYRRRTERPARQTIPVSRFRIDTVGVGYLRAIGAMTKRQAESFVRWRDLSGIRDMEEVRGCYVVSDSVASALEPYIIFPEAHPADSPIELNRADSAALRRVVGIGGKTVMRIIEYRERLGGFHRAEQLSEVEGVTEGNFEKILRQIRVDSCEIKKIDINFATSKALAAHPYMEPRALRRLLKQRQLKGGWSTADELIEDHILTREQAARLAPYITFGSKGGNDRKE